MAMSAATPTLLGLPQELQDNIWSHVIGQHVVHIMLPPAEPIARRTRTAFKANSKASLRDRLHHGSCGGYRIMPGEASHVFSKKLRSSWPFTLAANVCDRRCYFQLEAPKSWQRVTGMGQSISYFLVYREVYATVTHVLYGHNLFSFSGFTGRCDVPAAFTMFCANLSILPSASLRALHFQIVAYSPMEWISSYALDELTIATKWQKLFDDERGEGIKRLTGLQTMYLEIIGDDHMHQLMGYPFPQAPRPALLVPVVPGLRGVKDLALQELRIAISNMSIEKGKLQRNLWPMTHDYSERGGQRGMERELRAQLLGLDEEKGLTESEKDWLSIEKTFGLGMH